MEGVPAHLDYEAIGRALAAVAGRVDVHDLHIWHIGAGRCRAVRALAIARGDAVARRCSQQARRMLAERLQRSGTSTLQPTWPAPLPAGDRRVIPIAPAPERGDG